MRVSSLPVAECSGVKVSGLAVENLLGKGRLQIALQWQERAWDHDQSAVGGACECRDCAFDLRLITHADRSHINAKGWRYSLNCSEHGGPSG